MVDGLDVIWDENEKVVLLDESGGFGGAKKWVVATNADGTLSVGWEVLCTKDCVRVG